ncbi:hypothetical protein TNCV_3323901 [Trichonephila clavipes]|nr:hypothetical protein TNCV_3323901 [Trichonephila clavipes]
MFSKFVVVYLKKKFSFQSSTHESNSFRSLGPSTVQSVSHQIIVRVHRVCLSTYLHAGHCPDSADGDAFTGFLRSLRKISCLVMRYSFQHSWCKVRVIWYARHTVSSREKKKKMAAADKATVTVPVLTLKMNGLFAEQTCSSRYFSVGGGMSVLWHSLGQNGLMYARLRGRQTVRGS